MKPCYSVELWDFPVKVEHFHSNNNYNIYIIYIFTFCVITKRSQNNVIVSCYNMVVICSDLCEVTFHKYSTVYRCCCRCWVWLKVSDDLKLKTRSHSAAVQTSPWPAASARRLRPRASPPAGRPPAGRRAHWPASPWHCCRKHDNSLQSHHQRLLANLQVVTRLMVGKCSLFQSLHSPCNVKAGLLVGNEFPQQLAVLPDSVLYIHLLFLEPTGKQRRWKTHQEHRQTSNLMWSDAR